MMVRATWLVLLLTWGCAQSWAVDTNAQARKSARQQQQYAAASAAGQSEMLWTNNLDKVMQQDKLFADYSSDEVHTRHGRQASTDQASIRIIAARLRTVNKDVSYDESGLINVLRGNDVALRVHGIGLTNLTKVKLTTAKADFGASCKSESNHVQTKIFSLSNCDPDGLSGELLIKGDELPRFKDKDFFFCVNVNNANEIQKDSQFVHQGTSEAVTVRLYELLLPIWLMIVFIVILLCLSGLFSGLNLGLMALDQTELKIVQATGTNKEKSYANKIAPIRAHGNFLLCSLLLGNVLVNNTLTILLDTLTSGLVAVIGATMGIVVFGEIIPQAICSRHGLAVGAYTIWLTKFFMMLTFPLSFPISKLLDKLLGAEIGTVYDKKKLIELLRVTDEKNDLEKEEADIVTGALMYKDKTVKHVMTKMEDVYMLPMSAVLDFDTVAEIRDQGYSRIPVYNEERNHIVHILFAKDLMFVDPDDKTPVTMVCEFYDNEVNFVFHDTPLNVMFNEFKSGDKGHMAFVQQIENSGEGDPYYETIGLVTLEDIIEEIIQQEIVDETDVVTDNRTKKKRRREGFKHHHETYFAPSEDKKRVNVSPQLNLAVFQYLTTSVEPFKQPHITDSVLKRLLSLDVFRMIKIKKDRLKMDEDELIIVHKDKPMDYFVLIIEGRVEVTIGPEQLIFEGGPFTFFGINTLTSAMNTGLASPSLSHHVHKSATTSQMEAGLAGGMAGPRGGSLRKTSTNIAIEMPTMNSMNPVTTTSSTGTATGTPNNFSRRHTSVTTQDILPPPRQASSMALTSGSLSSGAHFVPDYSVKAISDTLYLRIKKATYLAALRATQMFKKHSNSDIKEEDLDMLLEKVNEDEDTTIMMRSPAPSPGLSPEKRPSEVLPEDIELRKNGAKYLLQETKQSSSDTSNTWKDDETTGLPPVRSTVVTVSGSGGGKRDSPPFIDVSSIVQSSGSNGPGSLPAASTPGAGGSTVIAVRGSSDPVATPPKAQDDDVDDLPEDSDGAEDTPRSQTSESQKLMLPSGCSGSSAVDGHGTKS